MNSFQENKNIKTRAGSHMSDYEVRKKEYTETECENLDDNSNSQPVENLRRSYDENEDFDFVYEEMKTTNIKPIPLINKSNQLKKSLERKCINPELKESYNFEDLSQNIPLNSTFIEHKNSPLQLELSPITEDTLDEDCENLRVSDTSSDWYTIEQWKLDDKTTKLSNIANTFQDSECDEDYSINLYTHVRADDSNNKMETERLYKSTENEFCIEEKKTLQETDGNTFEKDAENVQEKLLKLPGTLKIQKAVNNSTNESIDSIYSLEETKTKNVSEYDMESNAQLKDFIHRESLTHICSQRKYKSIRVQNENVTRHLNLTRFSKKIMFHDYKINQCCELKKYNMDQEFGSKFQRNLDSNNISLENKAVIDNECTQGYDRDYLADCDFGHIRLNNNDEEFSYKNDISYKNDSLNTDDTCLLENISSKKCSRDSKNFSSYKSTSFSEDAEQDFLELLESSL